MKSYRTKICDISIAVIRLQKYERHNSEYESKIL